MSIPCWLMLRPYFAVTFLAWGSLTLPALAQSITTANDGTGTIVQFQGQTYEIQGGTQAGANLFHSFQQFGLNAGEIAQFLTQPDIANVLGRVTGGDASVINGLIQVTGSAADLYLINPAGILFGPGARLDVPGSFTATTGDRLGFPGGWFNATGANDYATLSGAPFLVSFLDQGGLILNQGDLAVNPGESLSLIGGQVINTGSLTAPGGTVVISAVEGSQRVRLSQPGHLLSLELEPDQIAGNSPLRIQDLPQMLTGKGIDPGFTVTPTGELQLSGSDLQIPTQGGTTVITGQIETSGAGTGGNIGIFGSQIALVDAEIAANGQGGGTILIGGEQQGRGPVPNASHLFIDEQSEITANGVGHGDGGRVILFASDTARIFGNLSARGGDFGGNGGFIETSGLRNLEIQGSPDVAAPQGQAGTWLIDPNNITIHVSVSSNMTANPFTSTNDGAFLSVADLTTALASGATVRVVTGTGGTNSQEGNITLADSLTYSNTSTGFLSLEAHNSIFINNSISSTLSSLNLTFSADRDNNGEGRVVINADIFTNGGSLTISGSTLGTESAVSIGPGFFNGSVSTGGGAINITGSSVNGSGILIQSNLNSQGGNITLNGVSRNPNFRTRLDDSGELIFIVDDAGVDINFGLINSSGGNIRIVGNGVGGAGIAITGNTISSFGGTIDLIGDSQGIGGVISLNSPLFSGGGNINISHQGGETANGYGIFFGGSIDSSTVSLGNGGAIALSAPNNIAVSSLNSQSQTGRGGNITVTSQRFFQAIGSFTARNGVLASISAAGATGGGDITIAHGGNGNVPFIVGDANINQRDRNGTAAAITNGDFTINVGESFYRSHTLGNIRIITADSSICPPYCQETISSLEGTEQSNFLSENFAQGILQRIARATGVKPAIIYAGFVPAGVVAAPTVERLEANLSQGVQQFDPLQATPTDAAFSLEPQGSDRLQLLLLTAHGSPIVETLAITRDQIASLVGRFRRGVSNLRSQAYLNPAQELYRQLIAPFEAVLTEREIDNLVLIGDEGLRSLPLAALHDGNGFLVERFSLGQMPSLSLTNFNYQPITANTPVLAMGASEFTARNLSPLPAVPNELAKITQQRRGEIYLNEQFTWRNLKAQSRERQFQILHLATHALFDPNFADQAYIQLWGEEAIALNSLRELRLYTEPPLELLILSACTTAVGNQEAELGFAGAAVQAGVKSVLASLWQVSDTGTAVLMNELYYQLAQPEVTIKAEAVRRAQLALLHGEYPGGTAVDVIPNEDFSHPFYWSAFSLIGSPW